MADGSKVHRTAPVDVVKTLLYLSSIYTSTVSMSRQIRPDIPNLDSDVLAPKAQQKPNIVSLIRCIAISTPKVENLETLGVIH